jgi:hypothetical protein
LTATSPTARGHAPQQLHDAVDKNNGVRKVLWIGMIKIGVIGVPFVECGGRSLSMIVGFVLTRHPGIMDVAAQERCQGIAHISSRRIEAVLTLLFAN